jgi:indolepyruvate ferredoxin oxidoreductase alpha subunit
VDRLIVIEEIDPFLQENILAMGIKVMGKEFIPRTGELNPRIVEEGARKAGLLCRRSSLPGAGSPENLPRRPPLLCAGCPHAGIFFVLSTLGQRARLPKSRATQPKESGLIITGDIGCYTLGAYPPLSAMDTCACMGASIGQALGMEKAGVKDSQKVVAVIGDSTFMHSGITPLVNAVYNQGRITVLILDNMTTAMTGHQPHPGTGVSARGEPTQIVELESLVRGIGVKDVKVVDAFNIKALRSALRDSLDAQQLSVIIVRGNCSVRLAGSFTARTIDREKCNDCGICLLIGCPAIQNENQQTYIEAAMCVGDACTVCQQVCPRRAIARKIPNTNI